MASVTDTYDWDTAREACFRTMLDATKTSPLPLLTKLAVGMQDAHLLKADPESAQEDIAAWAQGYGFNLDEEVSSALQEQKLLDLTLPTSALTKVLLKRLRKILASATAASYRVVVRRTDADTVQRYLQISWQTRTEQPLSCEVQTPLAPAAAEELNRACRDATEAEDGSLIYREVPHAEALTEPLAEVAAKAAADALSTVISPTLLEENNWKKKAYEQDLVTLNGCYDDKKLMTRLEQQGKWDVATWVEDGIIDPSLSILKLWSYSYLGRMNDYEHQSFREALQDESKTGSLFHAEVFKDEQGKHLRRLNVRLPSELGETSRTFDMIVPLSVSLAETFDTAYKETQRQEPQSTD